MSKNPDIDIYNDEDEAKYKKLMIKTNALYYKYNPETNKTIGNKGDKWNNIQGKIWKDIKKGKKGKKKWNYCYSERS